MEFWPEFLASSWGREFIAGGIGGMAGVLAGHPLDTLRIRIQQPVPDPARVVNAGPGSRTGATSAIGLLRGILKSEGPGALYRGMGAPLASIAFQNAMVFQIYASLSRSINPTSKPNEPPPYSSIALAGVGTGAIQTLLLCPVELIKIRLQLLSGPRIGPLKLAKHIFRSEGLRGLYRGLNVTVLRDAPAHGVYFCTYEYMRERLHPGCRKSGEESLSTMLVSGGLAGVASWTFCYPLDVVKSRLQAQSGGHLAKLRYNGIADCFRKSVREEGYSVLCRGMGTTVARAFVVNGAIFSAYELALRFLNGNQPLVLEEN